MDAQLKALHAAMCAVLRWRKRVKAAANALSRGRRTYRPRWGNSHLLDGLEDDLSRAEAHHREAEAELLARWEEFTQNYTPLMQRLTPAPGPLLPASQTPMKPDPEWNKYRASVIAAITDVENLLRQHKRGVDDEGMTYEVAPLLGLRIDTLEDFKALHRVVKAVRYVAREAIRSVSCQQGGQFSLLLL